VGNAIVTGSPSAADLGLVVDNTVGSSGDSPVHIASNRIIGNVRLAPRRLICTGNFVAGTLKIENPCIRALVANNWIGDSEAVTGSPTLVDSTTGTIVNKGAGNYLDGTWTP